MALRAVKWLRSEASPLGGAQATSLRAAPVAAQFTERIAP
nr:MAG TPA: hypothetical protein [Caudoviricetes sp.]